MKNLIKYILIFVAGAIITSFVIIENLQITNIKTENNAKNGFVTISIFDYQFNYYFEK